MAGGGNAKEAVGLGKRGQFSIDVRSNGVDLQFGGLALRPFFQGDEKESGVGALNGAQEIEADYGGDVFDARSLKQDILDLPGSLSVCCSEEARGSCTTP